MPFLGVPVNGLQFMSDRGHVALISRGHPGPLNRRPAPLSLKTYGATALLSKSAATLKDDGMSAIGRYNHIARRLRSYESTFRARATVESALAVHRCRVQMAIEISTCTLVRLRGP